MFSIFKKAEKNEKNKRQYISVLLNESECGNRIALLVETRGRVAAMPNECDRDKVLKHIDEEIVKLVDMFGRVEYYSISNKDYDKMMATAVKKNLGI